MKVFPKRFYTIKSYLLIALSVICNAEAQNQPELTSEIKNVEHYRSRLFKARPEERLRYADSIIYEALKTSDNKTIAQAYLTKGIMHYNLKELSKALDNYVVANEYCSKTADAYTTCKIKFTLAQTKYYLGFYHEAIALFLECKRYFEKENDIAYINTLHALGLCYNKILDYHTAARYNILGTETCNELNYPNMIPYFRYSQGINLCSKKQYPAAIRELSAIKPIMQKNKDFANEMVTNFFIGKSYWEINQKEKAVSFLIMVDEIINQHGYIRPDVRESYEIMIDYYRKKGDTQKQLQYVEKLIKADSILSQNYKYLSKKIFREYDTRELLLEKETIKKSLESDKYLLYSLIMALTIAIGGISTVHYKRQKQLKQKFEALMNNSKPKDRNNKIINENEDLELDISPNLVSSILQNLEKFERSNKFLEKDMNLGKLAAILKTNTKYASKIILRYRGKKTIEYISDLKIDFVIELLKKQSRYRNYTNKALAEEIGFGSTQNFTKAFRARVDMSPTYFIQELRKSYPV